MASGSSTPIWISCSSSIRSDRTPRSRSSSAVSRPRRRRRGATPMPVRPTFPGVYIEEVPSGVRTIVGVATAIGAFIDHFARGPMNVAIQILSFADFEREFGGIHTNSEASYGIQQFFLNGGSEAWVIRTGAGGFDAASVELLDAVGGASALRITAGRRIRSAAVEDPGSWGN